MAQVFIRPDEAATYVGAEVTSFVTPTMVRATPIRGSVELDPTQTEIEHDDQRVHLYDGQSPILGNKDGAAKLGYYAKAGSDQLNAAATPATTALGQFLGVLWGGESVAAGSTIQSGSTASSIVVDAGHGSRFPQGQIGLFEVGGTLEPALISVRSTDTLTPWPSLSATPTEDGLAINTRTWYPEPASTASLTLQHALAGDSAHQWTMNGCIGDVELKTDRNGLIRFDFGLKVGTWTGPSSQSIVTTAGNDGMSAPFAVKDAKVYFQAAATLTRTHRQIRSVSAKFNGGMEFLPELGGTEGKGGVMRVGARNFADVTLRFMGSDVSYDADWVARTLMRLLVAIPQGSGLTKRWFTLCVPRCVIVGKPKTMVDGGVSVTELTVRAQIDSSASGNLGRAPVTAAAG